MKSTSAILIMMLGVAAGINLSFGDSTGYQQYYRHVNKYPDDVENTGFHRETNGIAHDDQYWYITNNDYDNMEALWKIPVTQDLYGIDSNTPGVIVRRSDNITCPVEITANHVQSKKIRDDLGYNHLGDLVAYKPPNANTYYLVVPLERDRDPPTPPAIAVLRADNLQCLGLDILRNPRRPNKLNDAAGWCAVDPQGGFVYTSPNYWNYSDEQENKLLKYRLNWNELGQAPVRLTFVEEIVLKNEVGNPLPPGEIAGYAQGGEFSEDGKLLYVSSGYDDEPKEYGGIQIFDSATWKRVARSHNDSDDQFFKYDWDDWGEEPEGLTIWDLDQGRQSFHDAPRAPHIHGQLHVLLLANGWWNSGDAVYIYHYTNTLYVDQTYPGANPDGTINSPYKTVGNALSFYNQNEHFNYGRWDGGRIKIHAGSYNEALKFSRRIQLVPWAGKAVIGSDGRVALMPGGVINITSGGALRVY